MTSKLTREKAQWLHGACEEAAAAGIKLTMNPNELLMFTSYVLTVMDSEPVVPIWGATKYPVSRPMPGTKLIVWDDTGKFVGYGSAVDTSESGVAIQMCDGRRLDSNHELRWQYALQPVPVVDNEPVAVCTVEDGQMCPDGFGECAHSLLDGTYELYAAPQPAPVVPDELKESPGTWKTPDVVFGWNACRAAMLQAGNSPVIPDGYVMVPKEPTEAMMLHNSGCQHHAWDDPDCAMRQTRRLIWSHMLTAAQHEVKS